MSAGKKLVSDTAAMSMGRLLQGASAFLALPFLARLLTPADFGLMSLAMSLVWVAIAFSDAGFGQSLVRVEPEETETWSSVFWLTTGWSAVLTVLLIALAWPAAMIMKQPELQRLVLALAPIPFLQGLLAVPAADLQRRRRFGALAIAEVLTAIFGFTAAVVLAMRGAGAWALVGQQYFMWAAKALVLLTATQFRPRFRFSPGKIREHSQFAGHTAAFGIASFLSQQADAVIIGRLLGTTQLGYYVMAYRLMSVPVYVVGGALQRVFYPRLAVLQSDPAAQKGLVLAASLAVASLVLPGMALLSAAHDSLFKVLLSERWAAASPAFAFLGPVGGLQTIAALSGAVFMATGHTGRRLRVTLEFALLWLAVLAATASFGIGAAAAGYAAAFVAYLPRYLSFYLKPLGVSQRAFARELLAPVLVAAAAAAWHVGLMRIVELGPRGELMVVGVELAVAYALTALAVRRRLVALYVQMRGKF
ncbi:MAG TPA: lipopolysaccharide biosynthesis protein [Phenylobacterium sp.]